MEVHLYASGSVPRCVEVHFIPATHHGGEINFSKSLIHLPRPVPRNCMRLYGLYSYTAYTAYTSLYIAIHNTALYSVYTAYTLYITVHSPSASAETPSAAEAMRGALRSAQTAPRRPFPLCPPSLKYGAKARARHKIFLSPLRRQTYKAHLTK